MDLSVEHIKKLRRCFKYMGLPKRAEDQLTRMALNRALVVNSLPELQKLTADERRAQAEQRQQQIEQLMKDTEDR